MKNRYEILLALSATGKEDTNKDIVERLEKVLAAEGAQVEQVQRLERREFALDVVIDLCGFDSATKRAILGLRQRQRSRRCTAPTLNQVSVTTSAPWVLCRPGQGRPPAIDHVCCCSGGCVDADALCASQSSL
jgi:hypothetical protein